MKITKFVHSCILVEDPSGVALFDPGHYSWKSNSFDITKLDRLDDIVISHGHDDHMFVPFLEALTAKFPDVAISAPERALAKLERLGFSYTNHKPSSRIAHFTADHEDTAPIGQPAANHGAHYLGKFTHPGDSYGFNETKEVLALPITAPAWGTLKQAAVLGQTLQPKYIVPIHDWQLSTAARELHYDRLEAFFAPLGITFLKLVDGQPVDLP